MHWYDWHYRTILKKEHDNLPGAHLSHLNIDILKYIDHISIHYE